MPRFTICQIHDPAGTAASAGLLITDRYVLTASSALHAATPGTTLQVSCDAQPDHNSVEAQLLYCSPNVAAGFAVLELPNPFAAANPMAGLAAPTHPPQQFQSVRVEGTGQAMEGQLGAGDETGRFLLNLEATPSPTTPLAGLPVFKAGSDDLLGIVLETDGERWLLATETIIQTYPILESRVQEAVALLEARDARQALEELYTISQQAEHADHVLQVGMVMGDFVQSGIDEAALLEKISTLLADLQPPPPSRSFPWAAVGAAAVVVMILLALSMFARRPDLPFPPAEDGETLIIVAPFAGAITDLQTFPDRYVLDALTAHVDALNTDTNPPAYRLERNPIPIEAQRNARALGEQYAATLVIWGQMDDVGGVRSFVEVMPGAGFTSGRTTGNWVGSELLPWGERAISAELRTCLLEGVPAQTDYLVSLSLGLLALDQTSWDEALFHFNTAITIGEAAEQTECGFNLGHAYYWRGYTHMLLEQMPDALADLTQALALDTGFLPALAQRGSVYLSMGYAAAATADFESAIDLATEESTHIRALLQRNLALALLQNQALDAARTALQAAEALEQERDDPVALAQNLLVKGAIEQQSAVNILQSDPESAADYLTKASTAYAEALSGLPDSYENDLLRAMLLENQGVVTLLQGDDARATALFDHAREGYAAVGTLNGQASISLRTGTLNLHQGNPQAALDAFDAALAMFEQSGTLIGQANAYAGQALAYNALGQSAEARTTADLVERILQRLSTGP